MLISTPVAMDFANLASSITIQGSGSASIIHIATGPGTTALELANLVNLVIDDVTFVGTQGVSVDAQVALRIDSVAQAAIRDTSFYGVGVGQIGVTGAVVWASDSDLIVEDCAFFGCAGDSSSGSAAIFMDDWTGFQAIGSRFLSTGMLNGQTYSKTNQAEPVAWIRVGSSVAATNLTSQLPIKIEDCRFDGGAVSALIVAPGAAGGLVARSVDIEDSLIDGGDVASSPAILLSGVQQVRISRTMVGWSSGATVALDLQACGNVELDDLQLLDPTMQTVEADAATLSVVVNNSQIGDLESLALSTLVQSGGLPSLPVMTSAQRDALPSPTIGTMIWDSDAGTLDILTPGGWVALTPE